MRHQIQTRQSSAAQLEVIRKSVKYPQNGQMKPLKVRAWCEWLQVDLSVYRSFLSGECAVWEKVWQRANDRGK